MNLGRYIKLLGNTVVMMKAEEHHALDKGGQIIEDEAKRVIGTYDYNWPPLAESTLDHKSADTPLLETGELRDSITHVVRGKSVFIGSDLEKAVWQELGTPSIPPRSFLMGAAVHKGKEAGLAVTDSILRHLLKYQS